jgi:hypothetical protein
MEHKPKPADAELDEFFGLVGRETEGREIEDQRPHDRPRTADEVRKIVERIKRGKSLS